MSLIEKNLYNKNKETSAEPDSNIYIGFTL